MRHHVAVELEFETYTDAEARSAGERLIDALRATADLFERKGIHNTGSAETERGIAIRWTSEQKDTRQ